MITTKAELGGEEGSKVLQTAMRRGVKRLDYKTEEVEEGSDEGLEGDRKEEQTNVDQPEEVKPPATRIRKEEMGDGWENIMPIKWKESPLGKETTTFSNLLGKDKKTAWPEE